MSKKTVFVVASKETDVVVLRPGMATMGRRADLIVVDRAVHYDAMGDDTYYDKLIDWLGTSVDTRLKPDGVKLEF